MSPPRFGNVCWRSPSANNWEFNRVLTRSGVVGLLCGLMASPHGERFLLQDAFVRHAAVAEPLNSAPSWNGPASMRPAAR